MITQVPSPSIVKARINAAQYATVLQCQLAMNRYLRSHGRCQYEEVRRAMIGVARCPGPYNIAQFTKAVEQMESDGTVTVETVGDEIYLCRPNLPRKA